MKKYLGVPCLTVATALALTLAGHAQSRSFEVASIKPSNPNPTGPLGTAPMVLPALGRVTATNVTLRLLVITAFQKQAFQVAGGPPWQNADKFDINAKAADTAPTTDQMLEMLQTLLVDRFKLKTHTETREVPIYALVLSRSDGKTGAKLKPSADTCPDFKVQQQQQLEAIAKGGIAGLIAAAPKPGETRPCAITSAPDTGRSGAIVMKATGQAISTLTLLLTQLTGRPVEDKTGLKGLFDFEIVIDLQTLMNMYTELGINVGPMPPLPEGPSLTTQLQEDLGLKLDSRRGPGEVLVIDSAERPSPD